MKESEMKEFEEKAKSFSEMFKGIFGSWKREKPDSRMYMYVAVEYDIKEDVLNPLAIFNSTIGNKLGLLSSMVYLAKEKPKFLESLVLPVCCFFTQCFENAKDYKLTAPTREAIIQLAEKFDSKRFMQLVEGTNAVDDDK